MVTADIRTNQLGYTVSGSNDLRFDSKTSGLKGAVENIANESSTSSRVPYIVSKNAVELIKAISEYAHDFSASEINRMVRACDSHALPTLLNILEFSRLTDEAEIQIISPTQAIASFKNISLRVKDDKRIGVCIFVNGDHCRSEVLALRAIERVLDAD